MHDLNNPGNAGCDRCDGDAVKVVHAPYPLVQADEMLNEKCMVSLGCDDALGPTYPSPLCFQNDKHAVISPHTGIKLTHSISGYMKYTISSKNSEAN